MSRPCAYAGGDSAKTVGIDRGLDAGLSCSAVLPVLAVEGAELHRLADMLRLYVFAARHVRDGAGHLEDAVVSPRGEPHALEGRFQQGARAVGQGTEFLQPSGGDAGVAGDARPLKTAALDRPHGVDPFPDGGGGFRLFRGGELAELHRRHLDMQIDAVEQGAGDPGKIPLRGGGGAGAGAGGMPEIPARAGVHPSQ